MATSAAACMFSQPDAATVAVAGALTFTTAARALREGARTLDAGVQAVRLDLGAVQRADSAGLACVIALAAHARQRGRELAVVNWPEGLHALAAVCGVAGLLEAPRG